jgi:hypothetical protein
MPCSQKAQEIKPFQTDDTHKCHDVIPFIISHPSSVLAHASVNPLASQVLLTGQAPLKHYFLPAVSYPYHLCNDPLSSAPERLQVTSSYHRSHVLSPTTQATVKPGAAEAASNAATSSATAPDHLAPPIRNCSSIRISKRPALLQHTCNPSSNLTRLDLMMTVYARQYWAFMLVD